jgi:DNA-binding MarR family transcriptional regulator
MQIVILPSGEDSMSEGLTTEQNLVLAFLVSAEHRPSYREIAEHLGAGYHKTTVMRILGRLERKGFVAKKARTPRSIQVLVPLKGAA